MRKKYFLVQSLVPSWEAQAQCFEQVTWLRVHLSVFKVGLLDKAVDSGHLGGLGSLGTVGVFL